MNARMLPVVVSLLVLSPFGMAHEHDPGGRAAERVGKVNLPMEGSQP